MEWNRGGVIGRRSGGDREDTEFHTCQMPEAAVRQYEEWRDAEQGQHILIAASGYIAAHPPTERQNLQTAQIARRLLRGEALYAQAT